MTQTTHTHTTHTHTTHTHTHLDVLPKAALGARHAAALKQRHDRVRAPAAVEPPQVVNLCMCVCVCVCVCVCRAVLVVHGHSVRKACTSVWRATGGAAPLHATTHSTLAVHQLHGLVRATPARIPVAAPNGTPRAHARTRASPRARQPARGHTHAHARAHALWSTTRCTAHLRTAVCCHSTIALLHLLLPRACLAHTQPRPTCFAGSRGMSSAARDMRPRRRPRGAPPRPLSRPAGRAPAAVSRAPHAPATGLAASPARRSSALREACIVVCVRVWRAVACVRAWVRVVEATTGGEELGTTVRVGVIRSTPLHDRWLCAGAETR
jgi:hypothetical protein